MPLYVFPLAGVGLAALYVLFCFRIVPKCRVRGEVPSVFRVIKFGDCDLTCSQGHRWRTDRLGRPVRGDGTD